MRLRPTLERARAAIDHPSIGCAETFRTVRERRCDADAAHRGRRGDLLRTTRRAIYAMLEREQLPGVIRIRRRVLIRSAELLEWLDQKRAPSLKE